MAARWKTVAFHPNPRYLPVKKMEGYREPRPAPAENCHLVRSPHLFHDRSRHEKGVKKLTPFHPMDTSVSLCKK